MFVSWQHDTIILCKYVCMYISGSENIFYIKNFEGEHFCNLLGSFVIRAEQYFGYTVILWYYDEVIPVLL